MQRNAICHEHSFHAIRGGQGGLMGFRVGDTAAPRLYKLHRVHLLGQCTDLNTILWTISTIRQHIPLRNMTLGLRPLQHIGVDDTRHA